ncbi:hypothetical protein V496_05950 [Pseudogymnoascus sp. VKM F-4515 (FW-2607)]|nr:hypothetical protein V496_05950 [Pseudogymnoascus sp. VKM F-4515 (FW-2607)]
MSRKFRVLVSAICLSFAAVSIIISATYLSGSSYSPAFVKSWGQRLSPSPNSPASDSTAPQGGNGQPDSVLVPILREGNATLLEMAPAYIKSIMTPEDSSIPRMECPALEGTRYDYLKAKTEKPFFRAVRPKYFFAIDLHQCVSLLPRLISSTVEAMRFLGPENCALSIVEGRSTDGTFEILKLLRSEIEGMGASYYFNSSDLNPTAGARIEILAELRNLAVQPLMTQPEKYDASTTVIFLNDVAICKDDILELIHQRFHQSADMVCAMDWTYVGEHPTFYDVWIARDMAGDTFFNIPPDGNWDSAWNLFWNNTEARQRFSEHKSFQVFSCWNGATAFTAKPLLELAMGFRGPKKAECFQGEPEIFCKEMWKAGYGKIAVVPSINLEYSNERGKDIKALKGHTSQWVTRDRDDPKDTGFKIQWVKDPPKLVKFNLINSLTERTPPSA